MDKPKRTKRPPLPAGPVTKAIGAWVRALRGKESQGNFGARAQIVQSTVSALEKGSRSARLVHVDAIATANHVQASQVFKQLFLLAQEREAAELVARPAPRDPAVEAITRAMNARARATRPAAPAPSASPAAKPVAAQEGDQRPRRTR